MATYTTPKTDWEANDYLTYTDYNRIKNNLVYLNDTYNELYPNPYSFNPGADMNKDEMFKASKWNMFEECVEHLQRSGMIYTFGEKSVYKDNGHLPNYIQLNRLEKCIEAYANYDVSVTGVTLTPSDIEVAYFKSEYPVLINNPFTPQVVPAAAFDKSVIWNNGDTSIAELTNNNTKIKIKKGGAGSVSVQTVDGGFMDDSMITVVTKIETAVVGADNQLSFEVGDTYNIPNNLNITPAEANYMSYSYSSSDTSVLTVDSNGVVTCVGQGNATITVTINQGTKQTPIYSVATVCNVTVIQQIIHVTGITLDKTIINLANGDGYTYDVVTPTIIPANATNNNIIVTSANNKVSIIKQGDQYRILKKAVGKDTVTFTTEDGGYSATCNVFCRERHNSGTICFDRIVVFNMCYADLSAAHLLSVHYIPVNTSDYNAKVSYGNNGNYQWSGDYSNLVYACNDFWDNCVGENWRYRGEQVSKKYRRGNSVGSKYFDICNPSCSECGSPNANDTVTDVYPFRNRIGEGYDILTGELTNQYIPTRTTDSTKCYALKLLTLAEGGIPVYDQATYGFNEQVFQFHQPLIFIESSVKVYPLNVAKYINHYIYDEVDSTEDCYIIDWHNSSDSITLKSLYDNLGKYNGDIIICDPPEEIRSQLGVL